MIRFPWWRTSLLMHLWMQVANSRPQALVKKRMDRLGGINIRTRTFPEKTIKVKWITALPWEPSCFSNWLRGGKRSRIYIVFIYEYRYIVSDCFKEGPRMSRNILGDPVFFVFHSIPSYSIMIACLENSCGLPNVTDPWISKMWNLINKQQLWSVWWFLGKGILGDDL